MFFKKKKNKREYALELYKEEEIEQLERHIEQNFGTFSNVFHEIVSPDIHVDIAVIAPTQEHNYYTLVTMGMGAHSMNIPSDVANQKLERAELLIHLPASWDISNDKEEWYWPFRWLKILARLPINQATWLGYGHTIPSGSPLADNTALCGMILSYPHLASEASLTCSLTNSNVINFYQIIPLYQEEMDYKLQYDAEALFEKLNTIKYSVLDINRKNVCL